MALHGQLREPVPAGVVENDCIWAQMDRGSDLGTGTDGCGLPGKLGSVLTNSIPDQTAVTTKRGNYTFFGLSGSKCLSNVCLSK